MFFVLSKILDFFITPLAWIFLCILFSILLKNKKWKSRLRIASLAILLVFTNPWLISRVMSAWEVPAVNAQKISEPYDVGIVLGGSMRYYDQSVDRVVYSSSVDRLLQALQLYHDKKIKKILLSGGSGFVNFQDWKESGLIASVLLKSGVPEKDILLENGSRNTYENASLSNDILKDKKYGTRFLLITSAFHMRRSLLCFEKVNLKVEPFSVDTRSATYINTLDKIIQPDAECLTQWDLLLHEWIGILMYKMMGYV
ncbi:MAG: YdcF family protein [Bacteroidetes bacterium]|nr:YdcF family protein [Bacteroidota bacterium]